MRLFFAYFSAFVLVCLSGVSAHRALAHGGPPLMDLSVTQASPGMVVEVRGHGIAPNDPITLTLGRAKPEITLANLMGDGDGDFTLMFELPVDHPAGEYYVWAEAGGQFSPSPPFMVTNPASQESEDGQWRDDEDGLPPGIIEFRTLVAAQATPVATTPLAPSPTLPSPTPMPNPTPKPPPTPAPVGKWAAWGCSPLLA